MKSLKRTVLTVSILFYIFGGVQVEQKLCVQHNIKDYCWITQLAPLHGLELGQ